MRAWEGEAPAEPPSAPGGRPFRCQAQSGSRLGGSLALPPTQCIADLPGPERKGEDMIAKRDRCVWTVAAEERVRAWSAKPPPFVRSNREPKHEPD